jgi:hypothetical protein
MTEQRPWWRAKGFLASATFLLAVVVFGTITLVGSGHVSPSVPATHPRAQPTGPIWKAHVETGGSFCGLAVGNTDKPVGPPDVTWKLVGQIAAPASPTLGPGLIEGKERRCFAHSPMGALMAAANWLATIGAYGDNANVVRNITARNHVRNVFLRQPAQPVDPAFRLQIAGFTTAIVDRDNVTVFLAVRTNYQGRLAVGSFPMHWEYGDWRTVMRSLEEPFQIAVIPSLDGYVPWGGA